MFLYGGVELGLNFKLVTLQIFEYSPDVNIMSVSISAYSHSLKVIIENPKTHYVKHPKSNKSRLVGLA